MTESTNINRKIKFASAVVTDRAIDSARNTSASRDMSWAAPALAQQVRSTLRADNAEVDLLIVFVSASLSLEAPGIMAQLQAELNPKILLGCSAEGVITSEQEIENQPAIAIVAGCLPGAKLEPFSFTSMEMEDWVRLLSDDVAFCEMVGAPINTKAPKLFIVLADPFLPQLNRF